MIDTFLGHGSRPESFPEFAWHRNRRGVAPAACRDAVSATWPFRDYVHRQRMPGAMIASPCRLAKWHRSELRIAQIRSRAEIRSGIDRRSIPKPPFATPDGAGSTAHDQAAGTHHEWIEHRRGRRGGAFRRHGVDGRSTGFADPVGHANGHAGVVRGAAAGLFQMPGSEGMVGDCPSFTNAVAQ